MLDILNQLDTRIFLVLNGMHNCYFDTFMKVFTMRYVWAPMYVAMLFVLFRRFPPYTAIVFTAAVILSIVLSDQSCATLIRPHVARLRPSNPDNTLSSLVHIVDGYRGGSYGFPSCHAANSFSLAMIMSLIIGNKKFTVFIYLWAALNSYSRLYLGVHYPGDLITGAVIGSMCAIVCYISAIGLLSFFPSGGRNITEKSRCSKHGSYDSIVIAGLITVSVISVISFFL